MFIVAKYSFSIAVNPKVKINFRKAGWLSVGGFKGLLRFFQVYSLRGPKEGGVFVYLCC